MFVQGDQLASIPVVGLVRADTWLLRNSIAGGNADITFTYVSASYEELPGR